MDESMAILHSPTRKRSNRLLTTHDIKAMMEYLEGTSKRFWHFGNTGALVNEQDNFVVTLFDNPILKIISADNKVDKICVYGGGRYDEYGNPYDLVRERLNGLLDALGDDGIIPTDVRVWYDRENSICYLIHHEQKVALNKNYCRMVTIEANPGEFVIDDMDIVHQSDQED